jgi:ankyrin repeat protein
VTKELLRLGANVNNTDSHGISPLHECCLNPNFEILSQLLNYDSDPNLKDAKGRNPLLIRMSNAHVDVEMVTILLEHKASVNCQSGKGRYPLHLAVESDNDTLVLLCLKFGANVMGTDLQKRAALHCACAQGSVRITEILCSKMDNLDSRDVNRKTALLESVRSKDVDGNS